MTVIETLSFSSGGNGLLLVEAAWGAGEPGASLYFKQPGEDAWEQIRAFERDGTRTLADRREVLMSPVQAQEAIVRADLLLGRLTAAVAGVAIAEGHTGPYAGAAQLLADVPSDGPAYPHNEVRVRKGMIVLSDRAAADTPCWAWVPAHAWPHVRKKLHAAAVRLAPQDSGRAR